MPYVRNDLACSKSPEFHAASAISVREPAFTRKKASSATATWQRLAQHLAVAGIRQPRAATATQHAVFPAFLTGKLCRKSIPAMARAFRRDCIFLVLSGPYDAAHRRTSTGAVFAGLLRQGVFLALPSPLPRRYACRVNDEQVTAQHNTCEIPWRCRFRISGLRRGRLFPGSASAPAPARRAGRPAARPDFVHRQAQGQSVCTKR